MKPLAVSISDMGALVGCGRSHAYELIRRGEVVAVKLGRKTVVLLASIEAMLERNAVGQSTKPLGSVPYDGSVPAKTVGRRRGTMCQLACDSAKQSRPKAEDAD